ncbi:MAG: tetratricopeptide repeat protein [Dehalococcoidia bacterium]
MTLFRRATNGTKVPPRPGTHAGRVSLIFSRKPVQGLLVVVGLAALYAAGLGIRSLNQPADPTTATKQSISPLGQLVLSRASTADAITALQQQLHESPNDPKRLTLLAQEYIQQIRENGDPGNYTRADKTLQKAYKLNPKNADVLLTMADLQFARHLFKDSLNLGMRAQALNPYQAAIYGVIGDSQAELGLDDQAIVSYQKMVDTRPDLGSYSRISYARELHGDIPGAISAMQQAVRAGGPNAENTAWTEVYLGNLYLNYTGDLDSATRSYRQALATFPSYVHGLAGMAAVSALRGDQDQAIEQYKHVVEIMPLPQYLIALGDLYKKAGRGTEADNTYQLVRTEEKLYQANGVDMDLDIALFDADHGLDLKQGLERAQQAMKDRPSTTSADVLAWTLFKSGKFQEATSMEQQALRLGSKNALFLFHEGMIESALGEKQTAIDYLQRSLQTNAAASNQPYFDVLYGDTARAELVKLQGGQ